MPLRTTRIQSNSLFQIYRRFPPHVAARIPVSSNQQLSPVQIVAQTSHETGYEIVPIAEQLGIKANDLEEHLQVQPGDLVRLGTILAERKKMFGRVTHITSPVEGTIAEVQDGNLYITRTPEDLNLRSLVHGTVSQLISGKGAIIRVFGSQFEAAWSNGVEGAGNLRILGQTAEESLQIEHLDVDLFGSIIAIGRITQPTLLEAVVESGASGLITGTVSPDVFQSATNWQLPFILTDGVGKGGIFPDVYKLLRENNGNHTALFGSEYSQSNRPKVVMINPKQDEGSSSSPNQGLNQPIVLKKGQKVRLLAGANKGDQGTIQKVHNWPQSTPIGLKTEGADVEFENGEVTFVSTANLDIIC